MSEWGIQQFDHQCAMLVVSPLLTNQRQEDVDYISLAEINTRGRRQLL